MLGYRGITGDILGSDNSIIITLDDNSIIYSDLKIPETFASFIKKGLPIKAKFSGNKKKHIVERSMQFQAGLMLKREVYLQEL